MSTSKSPYKDFNINGDESGILKRNLRPSKNTDKHLNQARGACFKPYKAP